jgi:hypothetical protein
MNTNDRNLLEMARAAARVRAMAIKSEKYAGSQPVYEAALERGHWELAALCFMVGAVEVLADFPPDARKSLEAIVDEIEGELAPEPRRRHSRRDPRGHRH